jgi:basic membrane lipoprotein Med (substrate-binding protein (PBP1-ABC) superfamily)
VEAVAATAADAPPGLAVLLGSNGNAANPATSLRVIPGGSRLMLVIDQFEELFTITDEVARRRFLSAIAAAVADTDTQLTVVLALRADYYDRPLLHPEFAQAFIPGVVNALPMTASELEAVVVRPAERAGAAVEQALLAELVADAGDRPGTLPLLEYALTELFDQKTKGSLTLEGYRALGGMSGVLSRSAEALFGALSADEKQVAMQVFLRLVQLGHGTAESRRRLPISDLTSLDLDPVLLSKVLESFGDRRLLSFDRDTVTGQATVEVAHESLFREWERLAAWIDRHRTALRRYETFTAAAEEWEASGKRLDYLLTGTRLAEFEAWSREGTLQISGNQRAFLDAGLARQADERAAERARAEAARRFVWPSFVDDRQNSAYAFFAENEGAYLAGVAAALKSRTGRIGFIGGHDDAFMWVWHAGYEAGARSIRPDIQIMSAYLSSGEVSTGFPAIESTGFHDAPAAEREARAMFEAGADVIFHAAGDSGVGVFEAAFALSGAERHLWAIGVDTDQYVTVRYISGAAHPDEWRQHILTSVLKRLDLAMYQLGAEFARGQFRTGRHTFDLANGGMDISYSGGFIEDIRAQIDSAKQQIISGRVRVPCTPVVKLGLARERGYPEDWCHN